MKKDPFLSEFSEFQLSNNEDMIEPNLFYIASERDAGNWKCLMGLLMSFTLCHPLRGPYAIWNAWRDFIEYINILYFV